LKKNISCVPTFDLSIYRLLNNENKKLSIVSTIMNDAELGLTVCS